jgi:hypothetical protein
MYYTVAEYKKNNAYLILITNLHLNSIILFFLEMKFSIIDS